MQRELSLNFHRSNIIYGHFQNQVVELKVKVKTQVLQDLSVLICYFCEKNNDSSRCISHMLVLKDAFRTSDH